jgi:hypothetical protein
VPAYMANPVKGKAQALFEQARDTAAELGAMLLLSAGLQTKDQLQDYVTVADMLAASNDEANFANYARKILPTASVTVDNTGNRVLLGVSGTPPVTISWPAAGVVGGPFAAGQNNQLGKICYYYDPTPGTSTTATLLVIGYADISATTDGSELVFTLGADGLFRYTDPA